MDFRQVKDTDDGISKEYLEDPKRKGVQTNYLQLKSAQHVMIYHYKVGGERRQIFQELNRHSATAINSVLPPNTYIIQTSP